MEFHKDLCQHLSFFMFKKLTYISSNLHSYKDGMKLFCKKRCYTALVLV